MAMLLFNGYDANGNDGLWASDGTAAGTHELTGIGGVYTGGAPPFLSVAGLQPSDLTVFKGEVLFNGLDDNGQSGLWVTDGTPAGTHELIGIADAYSDAYSFLSGFSPSDLTVFNGEVLFSGLGDNGHRLSSVPTIAAIMSISLRCCLSMSRRNRPSASGASSKNRR
jgi:ELWxxDGT repeat protein